MGTRYEYTVYSITTRCNMHCVGCFRVGEGSVDLTSSIFLASCHKLKEIGCKFINLSGGEPLLHPCWKEFIAVCESFGIGPLLSTNGFLLEDLSEPVLQKLVVLSIPLDGDTASVNDKMRLPGHFDRVISLISGYKSGDFPFVLKINTVVTRYNYKSLVNIPRNYLDDERIIWKLFQVAPRGNFSEVADDSAVSKDEFEEIVEAMQMAEDIMCKVTSLAGDAGVNYLIVDPVGDVFVPAFSNYRRICNLLNDDVAKIIQEDESLCGNSFPHIMVGK